MARWWTSTIWANSLTAVEAARQSGEHHKLGEPLSVLLWRAGEARKFSSPSGCGSPRPLAALLSPFIASPVSLKPLWARGLDTQRTEARVKCSVLNRMTQLGRPETVRVG
jgi:hypothetical protein